MPVFTIRDVSETAAQAIRERAAAAGKSTEAFIREWIEQQVQEPIVRQVYGVKALGPGNAHATIRRGPDGLTGQGAANMSQAQADAYKRAKLLIERNGTGDRERAFGLLSAVFEDVLEVAG